MTTEVTKARVHAFVKFHSCFRCHVQQCVALVSDGGKHAVQCPRQHRDRHFEHVPIDFCCALQLIAVLDVPQTEAASHRAARNTSVTKIDTTPANKRLQKEASVIYQ